jgi:hypothetical protein
MAIKVEMGNGVGEWGKQCGGCCFCAPCVCLGVFVAMEEGVCVRDCRGLEPCIIGTVGYSVGDEHEGRKGRLKRG